MIVKKLCAAGLLSVTVLLPAVAIAEAWEFQPMFRAQTGYDDNVRLREEDDSAIESKATVGLGLLRASERTKLMTELSATYINYAEQDQEGLDDTTNFLASVNVDSKLTERQRVRLGVSLIEDEIGASADTLTDEIGTDTGVVTTEVDRTILEVRPDWFVQLSEVTGLSLAYELRHVEFGSAPNTQQLFDYDVHELSSRVERSWRERDQLFAELQASRYEAGDEDADSYGVLAGYTRVINETSKLEVKAGFQSVELDAGGDENGFIYHAKYTQKGERTRAVVTLERKVTASARGTLLETDSASVQVTRDIAERFRFAMRLSYFQNEDLFADNVAKRSYLFFQPELDYKLSERWSAGLRYRLRVNDNDGSANAQNDGRTEGNAVFVTLSYDMPTEFR